MARDQYLPRTYLRNFTPEYLTGKKGGIIEVYSLWSERHRSASISKHVGFELDFYDNHPLDKAWQDLEEKWPETVGALQSRSTAAVVVDTLLSFLAIQFVRVPTMMERVSRQLSLRNMKTVDIEFEGRKTKAAVMDMVKTSDVLDTIATMLPGIKQSATDEYVWTCYHDPFRLKFITCDNPCHYNWTTGESFLPLALDLGLFGTLRDKGRKPSVRHRQISHEDIRKFNRLIIENAKRFVYCHTSSKRLVDRIKRHRSDTLVDPMHGGRSFANEPTTGDPIAMFKRLEALRKKDRELGEEK